MKTFLISIAAATALAAAVTPATAQPYGGNGGYGHGGNGGYGHGGYDRDDRGPPIARGDHLEERINRAERNRRITHHEARHLREQLRLTERLSWRYRADGHVTRWERADLDRRFESIRMQLRQDRHDRDYGYGYGDGYRR